MRLLIAAALILAPTAAAAQEPPAELVAFLETQRPVLEASGEFMVVLGACSRQIQPADTARFLRDWIGF